MCLAIPGKVISVDYSDPLNRSGRVDFGGIVKEINLSLVPEAQIGNYVIVHAGFAISVLDEAEARKVLEYIDEIAGIENSGEPG